MAIIDELLSIVLIGVGGVFFLAGSVGLLRFPDVFTRLHALTKADNVGLGLVAAGLALQTDTIGAALKLLLIWLLTLVSSATTCYLIARAARQMGFNTGKES